MYNCSQDNVSKKSEYIVRDINDLKEDTDIKYKKSTKHPYQKAIDIINKLASTKAPYEKMRVISNISKAITESINDYWKNYFGVINKTQLVLEADDLMSIFIYLLIKSQQIDTVIHLGLIKDFTTKVSKSTMAGYYYCTLEAGLSYIISVDKIEDFKEKGTKNSFHASEDNLKADVNDVNYKHLIIVADEKKK